MSGHTDMKGPGGHVEPFTVRVPAGATLEYFSRKHAKGNPTLVTLKESQEFTLLDVRHGHMTLRSARGLDFQVDPEVC